MAEQQTGAAFDGEAADKRSIRWQNAALEWIGAAHCGPRQGMLAPFRSRAERPIFTLPITS